MADITYNARKYIRFTADEFLALILTSAVVAFVLSVRELLFTHFSEAQGLQTFALMFIFSLFILIIAVWVCKIVAIRLGHMITYHAHIWGLVIGAIITIMSAGYLPVFLPGGFLFDQPERLRVGKWLGTHKGWEVGLIAGTFPLAVLLFVLLLNPIYIVTRSEAYLAMIIACCLIAIFSLVPLPMFTMNGHSKNMEWYRYLRGSTFGLDVYFSSRVWFAVLCWTVVIFALIAYILTLVGITVGIIIYALSLVMGVVVFLLYTRFFKA